METFGVSFAALMLKAELHMQIGRFDEEMDAGEWCLKDYIRRAWSKGYQTFITSRSAVLCGTETTFGSEKRREERLARSIDTYHQRWGSSKHYVVYFDRKSEVPLLADQMETILLGARQGDRFTLLLHRGQASSFHRLGWSALHTGIQIRALSALMPQKDIARQLKALQEQEVILVKGTEETVFPGADAAISFTTLARALGA